MDPLTGRERVVGESSTDIVSCSSSASQSEKGWLLVWGDGEGEGEGEGGVGYRAEEAWVFRTIIAGDQGMSSPFQPRLEVRAEVWQSWKVVW